MKISVIVLSGLFMYVVFATIFNSTSMVGNFGHLVGSTNLEVFGYFAYVDTLFLIVPMYALYVYPETNKQPSFYIGWFFGLFSTLFFSILALGSENSGLVGSTVLGFLEPAVGKVGMWLMWTMATMVSLVILKGENFSFRQVAIRVLIFALAQSKRLINKIKEELREAFPEERIEAKEIILLPENNKMTNIQEEKEEISEEISEEVSQEIKEQQSIEIKEEPKREINKVVKVKELSENTKILNDIEKGKQEKPKDFKLPKIDFLQKGTKGATKMSDNEIDNKISELISKLKEFKIEGEVVRTYTGPIVTTFEFKPEANVKVSKILNLQDDLAMALSAETIRIQAPIPGRNVVGIEIPNENFDTIYLRDVLEDDLFKNAKSPLTVALGKDIVGNPFITDIKKLPHVLIAGTTGSGKSVGINAMILSLLYRNDPDSLKLMLIDPKMLEFTMYNDIPHLLTPVITDPSKAIIALSNMVSEMERRYTLMAESRTKNIDNYNEKAKKEDFEPFPFIVVVIDELADLMMNGGKEVEISIARLAQKSRACGIHLIVATQRPSVDVVTGLIKANLPSRLSYRVGQKIDSKVILDAMGAESLLGNGDGLFTPPGTNGLVRIHAPWNSEEEIDTIVNYIKKQRAPQYDEGYLVPGYVDRENAIDQDIELDELYEQAKETVLMDKKTSISYMQRKLSIGYNRAANIIDQLEAKGVLSAPNAKGNREIL